MVRDLQNEGMTKLKKPSQGRHGSGGILSGSHHNFIRLAQGCNSNCGPLYKGHCDRTDQSNVLYSSLWWFRRPNIVPESSAGHISSSETPSISHFVPARNQLARKFPSLCERPRTYSLAAVEFWRYLKDEALTNPYLHRYTSRFTVSSDSSGCVRIKRVSLNSTSKRLSIRSSERVAEEVIRFAFWHHSAITDPFSRFSLPLNPSISSSKSTHRRAQQLKVRAFLMRGFIVFSRYLQTQSA